MTHPWWRPPRAGGRWWPDTFRIDPMSMSSSVLLRSQMYPIFYHDLTQLPPCVLPDLKEDSTAMALQCGRDTHRGPRMKPHGPNTAPPAFAVHWKKRQQQARFVAEGVAWRREMPLEFAQTRTFQQECMIYKSEKSGQATCSNYITKD